MIKSGLGLQWIGKNEVLKEPENKVSTHFKGLEDPVKAKVIVSLDSLDSHVCITGDNLKALQGLSQMSQSCIDLIYIDPPYNTGNEFIYSDTAKLEAEEGSYQDMSPREQSHCAWLSMMYSRLKQAKVLLSNEGSIWISIDDNELAHLILLMNEIFGEDNHVGTIITSLNPKGRQLGRFATCHEYLVVYAINLSQCRLRFATEEAVNPKDFRHKDKDGSFRYLPLRNSNKRFNPHTRPTLYYPLYINPESGEVRIEPHETFLEVYPVFGSGEPAVWRWSKRKVLEHNNELVGTRIKGRLGERWDIKQKDYLTEKRTRKLKSIWLSDEVGSTDEAAREVKALNLEIFDTPKPTRLIRRILSLAPKNSVVLDFFAGSGTTADAVFRQNLADGGQRKFIVVQEPTETGHHHLSTIAKITQARIIKVIEELKLKDHVQYLELE